MLLISYTCGNRVKPRRFRRSHRVIPTYYLPNHHGACAAFTNEPLRPCQIASCQEVSTVGDLCLTHWQEKVLREQPGEVVAVGGRVSYRRAS